MTMADVDYADKIAKLLRKAEDKAATPQEAEAFLVKAQALMTQYAITEEMLSQARGVNLEQHEEVVEETIRYTGVYSAALFDIGAAIARANDAKVLISNGSGKWTTMHVIGHKSDVDRIRMLDASVQIQASSALLKWAREPESLPSWMSASHKYKARREFLFGFARGLTQQLHLAREKGKAAAAAEETKRTGGQAADGVASVELIVRGKKERVDDWVDEHYGKKLRSVTRRYSHGGVSAGNAGVSAGRRADVSNRGRVSGNQRSITA
jgi:hypothetical protein